MDNLLGDEERELSFLIAEHCREMFPSSKPVAATAASNSVAAPATPSSDTLAYNIAIVLANCGWCCLVDLLSALHEHRFSTTAASTTEDALRSEVKRLMHHTILRYDPRTGRYALNLLFASMRILFPLMAACGGGAATLASSSPSSSGAIAEAALHILFEHHDMPLSVLCNMVSAKMPVVGQAAVDRAVHALQTEGWLVQVSATGGTLPEKKAVPSAPAPASAGSTPAAAVPSLVASFGINFAKFLARYRSDLSVKYACESMTPLQKSVAHRLAQHRKPEALFQVANSAEANPFAKLPLFGEDVSSASIKATAAAAAKVDIPSTIRQLAAQPNAIVQIVPTPGAPSSSSSSSSSAFPGVGGQPQQVTARFSFDAAARRIRRCLMVAEVRARWGSMGQRIARILFEHKAVEDKHLAEESLISLQDLHNLLLPMQQMGVIAQQELLRPPQGGINVAAQIAANSGPDRNVKQSIFLWTIQERNLLALVRKRVCKSICALRTRLRAEYRESTLGLGSADAAAVGQIRQRDSVGVQGGNPNIRRQVFTVGQAERQRFEMVQDHLARGLAALYEELAITFFF